MTDHAISYISCVSVPSENIKSQSKNSMELFFKAFKKRKRNFTAKLNKNQIDKSQIISYYNKKIIQLNKIKNERFQKIILLTQELFENVSDDEENNKACEKFDLKEVSSSPAKKIKLDIVDEVLNNDRVRDEITIELIEVDHKTKETNADIMEIIEEDDENQKEIVENKNEIKIEENPNEVESEENQKETEIEKFPQIDLDEREEIANSEMESSSVEREMDKTFDLKPKVIEAEKNDGSVLISSNSIKSSDSVIKIPPTKISSTSLNLSLKSKIIGLNTNAKISKADSTSNRMPIKNSQLKTPQEPLYKGKYYPTAQTNSMSSSKSNTLTKSQTLSSQKKPLAEIRKQQEKIEEEKRRKLEENKAKRKENLMKLAEINGNKKIAAAVKSKTNNNSVKPGISNVLKTANLPSGLSLKSNMPDSLNSHLHKPVITNNTSQNKFNSIEKFPMSMSTQKIGPNALKPINSDVNTNSNSTNTDSQSSQSILTTNLFKTPFSKKRLTILSESCKKIISNHESYDLSDLVDVDSDEEDEENRPKHRIPRWCQKDNRGTLFNLIKYQSKHCCPSDIFLSACHVITDYKEIFGESVKVQSDCLEPWN